MWYVKDKKVHTHFLNSSIKFRALIINLIYSRYKILDMYAQHRPIN